MIRRFAKWSLPLVLCVIGLFAVAAQMNPPDWKKVEQARKKGLPKTAIKELEPILKQALRNKDYPWAVRALCLKINLETQVQGGKPEEAIRRLEQEIKTASQPMKPILHAVLAHWYWNFYQHNRWRFMRRTQAAGEDEGDDLMAWSLPRILRQIDEQFTTALQAEQQLKKIPLKQYQAIIQVGNAPNSYRPTLFDFLAYEALKFYSASEQAANTPADAWVVQATSPVFDDVDAFLKWKIPLTKPANPHAKALALYQRILKNHAKDDDRSAWIDADLGRLVFGRQAAVGTEKDARYISALEQFTEKYGDHPITTRAFHRWAAAVYAQDDWVKARAIAQRGIRRAPKSVGANRCRQLIAQIEAKELTVKAEQVWNAPWPEIEVHYRNISKLHFRIVKFNADRWLKTNHYQPEQLNTVARMAVVNQRPVKTWSVELPPTRDFHASQHFIPVPKGLAKGAYFLIASPAANFGVADNIVVFKHFWVSDLSVVVRNDYYGGILDGIVTNAKTGVPLTEATIQIWNLDRNNNRRTQSDRIETDAEGRFVIRGVNRNIMLDVHYGDDRVVSNAYYYLRTNRHRPRTTEQTYFFTDRAIYRPGQTIHYKGLATRIDQQQDQYKALAGRDVIVAFRDANGKEIARQQHRTNEFGTFHGSFTAPSGKLLGRMSLTVINGPRGNGAVRVEEYKRPKFRSQLNAPDQAPRLGGKVTVTGKATGYTGAPIDGASVKWRVVRRAHIPYWWLWERGWWAFPQSQTQEIASGQTQTDGQGNFELTFPALPDPKIDKDSPVRFNFVITADVTDSTGETRSASRTIVVARQLWSATVEADSWQETSKPVQWRIRITTLGGEGVETDGTLRIYRLKQPQQVVRKSLSGPRVFRYLAGSTGTPTPKTKTPSSDPRQWPLGEQVHEQQVSTDGGGVAKVQVELEAGVYRAVFTTRDPSGEEVAARANTHVLDPAAKRLHVKIPFLWTAKTWTVEPGEKLHAIWGTGYQHGRALIEIEHRRKIVKRFWTDENNTQQTIEIPVDESMRGGFTVHVTMIRENRLYSVAQAVSVPWTNKQLVVKWEHFVSKLKPGQRETWTLIVSQAGGDQDDTAKLKAAAELVATLYDASLDAFAPHRWASLQNIFRRDHSARQTHFFNQMNWLTQMMGQWKRSRFDTSLAYPSFHPDVIGNMQIFLHAMRRRGGVRMLGRAAPSAVPAEAAMEAMDADFAKAPKSGGEMPAKDQRSDASLGGEGKRKSASAGGSPSPQVDLDAVGIRKNLQETAFFFPALRTDKDGNVRIEFTMPEALTEWRFMALAHDAQLRSGMLADKAVTRKELMVQPNPPRFLRENDTLEFTVKVSNQSATSQQGQVRLQFADARTNKDMTEQLGIANATQSFDIPAGRSATFSWKLHVPDGMGFLVYRAVAATEQLSDGEENYLPVLPRRILVRESLPLPIRGPGSRTWNWKRLIDSAGSDSIVHQSLTIQAVSQPAWYAVLALPYLMEFPHECNEQVFNRVYANLLARKIITSDPKMKRIVDQWRNTPAELSPLEKNQDLKSILLEETPWVREAESETQARKNLAILFDENRIRDEVSRAMNRLQENQRSDGAWSWFPGGPANDYMTLYIVTGFARLDHLGVEVDLSLAHKAVPHIDRMVQKIYDRLKRKELLDRNNLSPVIAFYLYGRSFYLESHPIPTNHKTAVDYFLKQAEQHWLTQPRQSQGHLALALNRFGKTRTAKQIMRSIHEHSVVDEELGMFWRDTERSWWWYRAPIETQALMVEAFDEVMNDKQAVDDCQVWLIKQKQTQNWKTTKATADACYALLRRGANRLASDVLLQVSLGGQLIKPDEVEAGTGFYEQRFTADQIKADMGKIKLVKQDEGVAWASLHWQYFEDVSRVKAYEGTPLTLKKQLFVKRYGKTGAQLEPLSSGVEVGDVLVVRVELRVDRAMEYVHLKDQRPSGSEPVDVLSGYRYQDGLAYYQMTRDTASHFFIDYLPKGTYVFEYETRIQHKGKYQSGIAQIECMYAPEFKSHSESHLVEVK